MDIHKLNKDDYAGQKFSVRYITNGYFDIQRVNAGFQIVHKRFEKPTEMSFDDFFFSEWLDDPVAFGAF